MKKKFPTYSSEETKRLGSELAKILLQSPVVGRRGAAVVALQGDLGAGKTTFVQGFFKGLGIKRRPASPTFVIMRRSNLSEKKRFSNVFHIDAYRLKEGAALQAIGFQEILSEPKNIILIEWAENVKKILPKDVIWLKFHHGKKETERMIVGDIQLSGDR